ncbi:hypothetical protein OS965_23050 [Streptomyces sp. H27-G5]|uniref:hypothetical protein n=1 Tax=Streptomyces sp. H27-G5 TaxID=2996698 RepID=UPI00226FF445|nr:hypothetical protein [Streptomyces sp. H27-G5]MCY0921026.1 hypothetical protein [Streptomyces sp. H27-G5]
MSTPEEQQRRQRREQEQAQEQEQQHDPYDPYGTQTWQSDTWDTGYQPVQPQLGGVQGQAGQQPAQPVAPEGWFREEAPAAPAQEWAETSYLPPYQEPYQEQPQQSRQPQPSQGQQFQPRQRAQQQPQQPQQASYGQPVTPEGWYREEAPAAPAQAWAETSYLPPYQEPQQQQPQQSQPSQGQQFQPRQQFQQQPQQPQPQQPSYGQPVAPEGWFREEAPPAPAPAPAPAPSAASGAGWAEETAYLPPQPAEPAVEATAYLPPVSAAPEPPQGPLDPEADAGARSEYSPPTLAGNTLRAVDPAQARAEGRSPIIDPGPQSAILTAALGLLLAAAAAFGDLALLVPLIALQGLTAAGWFRLNGMWPARQGIALAFLGAVVADAAVLAVDDVNGPGAIVGTLGAWVLLTLVLQLRSHADPDERMYGLMASVASAALAIVCAGYLAADSDAVSVGGVAVAVAVFARALPLPAPASVAVSLAAAAGAGVAVGTMTDIGTGGALLGLAAGVCALVGLRVAAYDYPSKFVHMTAGVALPLAAAAPAVYLMGRVVG